MEEKNISQGSQEWLDLRKTKIGASDAPVIMGESPYGTPYKLWQEKLGIIEKKQHRGMALGHELEPIARKLFEKEMMCSVEPVVIFHPELNYMMASLDGLNVEAKIAVEIKNPNIDDHNIAKDGGVPVKYKAQLQHQLHILIALYDINSIYYFSHHKGDVALVEVEYDEKYVSKMLKKEARFFDCMESFKAPELLPQDHDELEAASLDDAKELALLLPKLKELKEKEATLRKSLIEKAGKQNRRGGGIQMTRVIRKGAVDYKAIPELETIDLEKYRKSPVESWVITSYEESKTSEIVGEG